MRTGIAEIGRCVTEMIRYATEIRRGITKMTWYATEIKRSVTKMTWYDKMRRDISEMIRYVTRTCDHAESCD